MTTDKIREEFDALNGEYRFSDPRTAWLIWQAATEAAARRCAELCRDMAASSSDYAADAIEREFGLTEKSHG